MAISATLITAVNALVHGTNWTASGVQTLAASVSPDGTTPDTQWITSSVAGAFASFTLSPTDLAFIPNDATINSISYVNRAKYVLGAGSGTYTYIVGGTTYSSLTGNLSPATFTFNSSSLSTVNPDTGLAWTRADLNSLVIGFKNLSASTFTLYQFFVVISYSHPGISMSPTSGSSAGGDLITVTGVDGKFESSNTEAYNFGSSGFATPDPTTYVSPYVTTFAFPPADSVGICDVHVRNKTGTAATYFYGFLYTILFTNADGFTYVAPSYFTLSSIPAALIANAQALRDITGGASALSQFKSIWDSQLGAAYTTWVYNRFRLTPISLPAAIPIHWYTLSFSAPGTLWASTGTPSPNGWFQSTDGFASAANLVIGDVPHNPRSFTEIADFATGGAGMLGGFPGTGINFRNHFIYASGDYTVSTDAPSLHLFDGLSDRSIVTLPNTSAGVIPKAIISLLLVGEVVYLSTLDSGTTASNFSGRVFAFEPLTGNMSQIGAAFSGGEVPYALCWHMNRLWVGTNKSSAAGGKVYYFRPDIDTAWTTDYTLATSTAGSVCSLASYHGKLLVGADDIGGTFAKVLLRDSAGAYTTTKTASGGTATLNNGFLSMIVFQDNLYATYWNPDTTAIAVIYKFDGTSWTTAYSGADGLLRPYVGQYITNNTLLTIGGGNALSATILETADGTTYTDRTAQMIGTSTASPVFGEVVI